MPMNSQEVFDTVAKHLLKQGKVSFNELEGRCAYRTLDGDMCAIGCLIPDDMYSSDIEGLNVASLRMDMDMSSIFDSSVEGGMLTGLQHAHDFYLGYGIEPWAIKMRQIANHYDLDNSVLDGV